jgi:N-methylhydantoinase B
MYNLPTGGTRHPWITVKLMHLICSLDKTAPLNHGLYASITVAAPAGTATVPGSGGEVGGSELVTT